MATIVNDKDKILQAATVRLGAIPSNYIYFSEAAPVFNVNTSDVATPSSYAITAILAGQLTGTVTWSVVSGTVATTGQSGNTWTISYANLTTDTAIIKATLVFLGTTYSSQLTISKVRAGATGAAGLNNATVSLYAKNTSATTAPAAFSGTFTYTFSPPGLTGGTLNGWSTSAPSITKGEYLWVRSATASSNTATDTIAATEFSTAVISSVGGVDGVGSNGANGLSSLTAYKAQAQNLAAPTFTTPTTGATAPTGWSLTAPTVAVGEVLWYIDGRYNSSTVTINSVAANTTAWTGPVAASIFQDIRSDNWNGSTPPTYGTPATYGTTGYYISRSTGNAYLNNGIFRGDINTSGDGKFAGANNATTNLSGPFSTYKADYSVYGEALSNADSSSFLRVGVYGKASESVALYDIGVLGEGTGTLKGIGVMGLGTDFGGYFVGTTNGSRAAVFASANGSTFPALWLERGTFKWGAYTISQPGGSTSTYLRNDGAWSAVDAASLGGVTATSWARVFPTNSGTANAAGSGLNLFGSTSTGIAGAYVGTSGSGNVVTFTVQSTSPSDIRLKSDIQDVDLGLDFVKKLRPVSYKLKADPKQQKGYGFIAQEVEQLIGNGSSLVYYEPDWKVGEETGFNTIHYPSYIAVLTKAIQELTAKVENLEQQLANIAPK